MKTILVADDNLASRELLRGALETLEVRIIEAADGQEALRIIQAESPDLVLLDIQMPSLDGFAVLRAVRDLNPTNPAKVIALTAFAMESDRQRITDAGFDGYMAKPISIADVRRLVAQILVQPERASGV
jgi:two-component system cell cycle response regulator DivK